MRTQRLFRRVLSSLLLLGLIESPGWPAPAEPSPPGPLSLEFEQPHMLVIRGAQLPGGPIRINYLEAYCRANSTDADWVKHTVIPHKAEVVSMSEDRTTLRLRDTFEDDLLVEHTIKTSRDEVAFDLWAWKRGFTRSEAHWAQACVRLGPFTGFNSEGGDLDDYLPKCFIFLGNKLVRLSEVKPWAKSARYTPGQTWAAPGVPRTDVNPRPLSSLKPSNGLIGAFSADERLIFATAWEPCQELFQGVARCLHSDFRLEGLQAGETKRIRGKIYVVPNDVPALLARYSKDFPEHAPLHRHGGEPGSATDESGPAYVILRRGDVEAVIVDNRAVDDAVLPGHKAGYHGVAALRHTRQPRSLFVPAYAGLNFEHIHDGAVQPREVLFEPRHAPMKLRALNPWTAELHQPPTPHWGLESRMRYELLPSGVIEMCFECVPRKDTFKNGYCGLFWASYIDQPESLDIHFLGLTEGESGTGEWQRGVTPSHGKFATHRGALDQRSFAHDAAFPLELPFGFSAIRYSEPWYFGVCRGMAFVQMFRADDGVWLTQSPSGGGAGCPAWDFQWFIQNPRVGETYRLRMRAGYIPLERADDIQSVRQQVMGWQRTHSPLPATSGRE